MSTAWFFGLIIHEKHKGGNIKSGNIDESSTSGFTFIEIIVVLLVIGILGAVAMESLLDYTADVTGAAEVVKGHLRYAQIKAINSNVKWGINFSSNSYTLRNENGVSASLPGDLPQGIAYSVSTNPVMFDLDGSPGTSSITITLTKGTASRAVIVVKNTGAVYVQ